MNLPGCVQNQTIGSVLTGNGGDTVKEDCIFELAPIEPIKVTYISIDGEKIEHGLDGLESKRGVLDLETKTVTYYPENE